MLYRVQHLVVLCDSRVEVHGHLSQPKDNYNTLTVHEVSRLDVDPSIP